MDDPETRNNMQVSTIPRNRNIPADRGAQAAEYQPPSDVPRDVVSQSWIDSHIHMLKEEMMIHRFGFVIGASYSGVMMMTMIMTMMMMMMMTMTMMMTTMMMMMMMMN